MLEVRFDGASARKPFSEVAQKALDEIRGSLYGIQFNLWQSR